MGAADGMRIAIIGGGATGALAALHLARVFPAGAVEIMVIEPGDDLGRGLAYATDDPGHLLNVRVANMSAFPDEPDHLLDWLRRRGPELGVPAADPFGFIPRSVFGAYVSDLAQRMLASGAARHLRDRCVDLAEQADGVKLRLGSGEALVADHVILATGNDTRPLLGGVPAEQPWTSEALKSLPPQAPVLIVGTGLTMADMALSLDRLGHSGPIVALSRRGLLPEAHRPVAAREITAEAVPFGAALSTLWAWLRGLADRFTREGGDWRSAVDALRPHTRRLWRSMSLAQKRRFLRHARPYWDVRRHRMAPAVAQRLDALRAAGRLEIVAGRIRSTVQGPDGVEVEILRRRANQPEVRRFARLIDCTGLGDDIHRSANPVILALLTRERGRPDPLGIGLDIADDYAVIAASGRPSQRIWAIGPLARAAFWESIAIPDIRQQCRDLAQALAAQLDYGQPPAPIRPERG